MITTDIASIQQHHQTQPVGGRLQPAVLQGQQIPQQQTVIGVSAARPVTSAAGAQASIIQTQQPQQAVSIQQGQFYGQTQSQTQPHQQQQQQHRIIVQSPHASASAQVASSQQHCIVSQSEQICYFNLVTQTSKYSVELMLAMESLGLQVLVL